MERAALHGSPILAFGGAGYHLRRELAGDAVNTVSQPACRSTDPCRLASAIHGSRRPRQLPSQALPRSATGKRPFLGPTEQESLRRKRTTAVATITGGRGALCILARSRSPGRRSASLQGFDACGQRTRGTARAGCPAAREGQSDSPDGVLARVHSVPRPQPNRDHNRSYSHSETITAA
jgi:hypothetical protein